MSRISWLKKNKKRLINEGSTAGDRVDIEETSKECRVADT